MPNKVFTSFDVAAETKILKKSIGDSRINNIYQLNPKTLLLKLHRTGLPPLLLLLEAGRRFHLTAYAQEKPESPPAFCMALRKHLRNAWLRNVEQYEFERIVTFTFETREQSMKLMLELFGEGNLILTDKKGLIIQALVFKRMRDRNIVRQESYVFPPSSGRNPLKTSREDLSSDLSKCGGTEVVKTLARCLGIGGVYAEEVLMRAAIAKETPCSKLVEGQVGAIHATLQNMLGDLENEKFEPRIIFAEDGDYLDVVPFKLDRYQTYKFQPFSTFNEALDQFYLKVTVTEKTAIGQSKVNELTREKERLKRIVVGQELTVREAETDAAHEKLLGNTIYANSVDIQALLDKFNSALMAGKDLNSLCSKFAAEEPAGSKSQVIAEEFDYRNLAIKVQVGELHFTIGLRKSLFENAAQYYERGKKARQKGAGALAALEESRKQLAAVELRIQNAEAAQLTKPEEAMNQMAKRKVVGKEWYEKFRWFISSDGMLIVAGKDAVSNEVLVKKHAETDDHVFHAEIAGAPFVVVKTEGKLPPDQTLHEASEYAAAFSRGWREGLGSVDVYWVKPDQLKKTGPSGEYVAHGAFAVVGKRNWMRGVPLRTAVGIVENAEMSFVGGPVDAVKAKAMVYLTLLPGNVIGKEILKQVLQVLAMKSSKEKRPVVLKRSVEEIREFVPYTKGRIVE